MLQRKSCPLENCVSGHGKGKYIPKWQIRVCLQCRAAHPDGMPADILPELLSLGVSENEVLYNKEGHIIIAPFAEV